MEQHILDTCYFFNKQEFSFDTVASYLLSSKKVGQI